MGVYHEDRRMYNTTEPIMKWHKDNKEFLINRTPVATVGVVWSQQNLDFFGRDDADQLVELPLRGITQALVRTRIPYVPVHADHFAREATKLSAIILPNVGILTDIQITAIRQFVSNGGGVIATVLTGLFNESGEPKADYALSDLYGAKLKTSYTTRAEATRMWDDALHTYLRLTPELRRGVDGPHTEDEPQLSGKQHEIFKVFSRARYFELLDDYLLRCFHNLCYKTIPEIQYIKERYSLFIKY